jgi:hypothetical protein
MDEPVSPIEARLNLSLPERKPVVDTLRSFVGKNK